MESEQPAWGIKLSQFIPIPQRVILCLMCFLSMINAYALRVCLSIVLPRLVPLPSGNATIEGEIYCPETTGLKEDIEKHGDKIHMCAVAKRYNWSQSIQGNILGSFYAGYLLGQVPAGIIAVKFGAKWVLLTGLFLASVLTLLTPALIEYGGEASAIPLMVLRAIMGLCGAVSFPSLSAIMGHWVPSRERSFLGSLMMGGGQIGTVVANSLGGFILHHCAWPWVFYTFGALCLLWCFFFAIMCFNDPDEHPYIKPIEKEYLREHLGDLQRKKFLPIPFGQILTSAPVIALTLAYIAHDWGFYVVVTDLPKYMNDVLRFSIKNNGIFSALPFLAMWLCTMVYGVIADFTFKHGWLSLTNIRKFWTFYAATPCGAFLVLSSYFGCQRVLVVASFTIAMALCAGFYSGIKLTPNDLSRNYAGFIMAVANSCGAVTGYLAPASVGYMAPDSTMLEWRVVFWLAFFILTILTIPFLIWGTADVQPWDEPAEK